MRNIKNSLALKIGIAYVILTIINLIFFSVMIIENQTDLIITNFKHQSDNLAKSAAGLLSDLKIGPSADDPAYKALHRNLEAYDLNWYKVFDSNGNIWHNYSKVKQSAKEKEKKKVSKIVLQKLEQLSSRASLFRARYLVELQKEDFSIELLLPLGEKNRVFLLSSLNLKSMQGRLYLVYYQVLRRRCLGSYLSFPFCYFLDTYYFSPCIRFVSCQYKNERGRSF